MRNWLKTWNAIFSRTETVHLSLSLHDNDTVNTELWYRKCTLLQKYKQKTEPEDHWSCIAHLSAEDMLKSAVIEENKFKHSPWAEADNPLGPNV